MNTRAGLLVLFVLGVSWCSEARNFGNPLPYVSKNALCTLCEQYTDQALDYLNQNKTQDEIFEYLHHSCSQLRDFEQQCINLVDYYAPLFFSKLSVIEPETFCKEVNLCEKVNMFAMQLREDSCGLCRRTVSEIMIRLKDPDTQLEILEILLKACKTTKEFEKKCKRMVFEYGPLILANTEQFLEKTDICTALHACTSPGETVLLSAS